MAQPTTARREAPRKPHVSVAGSEHRRHGEDDHQATAWLDDTGPAMRLVALWKNAIARAEEQLVRAGCAFALLDIVAALSACFLPIVAPLLSVARLAGIVVLVPAVLRALAIAHADREDAELLKAIAIGVGLAAVYVAVRTWVVVQVCTL